jgi:hypothetical protein
VAQELVAALELLGHPALYLGAVIAIDAVAIDTRCIYSFATKFLSRAHHRSWYRRLQTR